MIKLLLITTLFTANALAAAPPRPLSTCGEDNRIFSYEQKIGRIVETLEKKTGCTATMIGSSCAITAGHCAPILNFMEFNVPHPAQGEVSSHALPEDTYEIDKASISFIDKGLGKDWAILKLLPNNITGQNPGDLYGFYDISFKKPKRRSKLSITGFGADRFNEQKSGTQQVATGKLKGFSILFRGSFTYQVDTEPGNSGSAVIDEKSQKIVGIHTNGGCSKTGGKNYGSLIYKNKQLIAAIKSCLAK